jgi:HEAT repeat protein
LRAEAAALRLPEFPEQALQELNTLLKSDDADLRWWAARALAEFGGAEAGGMLVAALADDDKGVRHIAALALAKHKHAEAVDALVALLPSSDSLMARLAADALITVGADAVPALIAATESEPVSAQVEAARALALIGDTRAISALFKLLENPSAMLEHWASQGLEKMGVGMSFFAPGG